MADDGWRPSAHPEVDWISLKTAPPVPIKRPTIDLEIVMSLRTLPSWPLSELMRMPDVPLLGPGQPCWCTEPPVATCAVTGSDDV